VTAILQDFISASLELARQDFCQQASHPLLIEVWRPGRLSFQWGGTRLSRDGVEMPLARKILREGNHLPVHPVRQKLPGPAGTVRVGRSQENDLVVQDDTVSARHAVFHLHSTGGVVDVRDVGSTNGTRVNDQKIVVGKEVVLFDGDLVAFGDVGFLFFYSAGLYDVLRACVEAQGGR